MEAAATPQRIIRTYLVIAGLYTLSASLIWGVNTLFLLDAGLDIQEVFLANAAFSAGMFLFEIPTGVVADVNGRRFSFLLSALVLALGTLGYVGLSLIGAGLAAFVAMSLVLGLGFTFYSGAVEAWLVDALNTTGYKGALDSVFARGALVGGAAMLIGTVTGGLLGDVNLAIPFIGRALLLLLLFVIASFAMHDIGYERQALRPRDFPAAVRRITRESITYGWQQRSIRLLLIVAFVQAGFTLWGFYAAQPYLLGLLGEETVWVMGVITAFVSLATMGGNALVEWFTRFCGRRTTLLIAASAVQVVAIIGMGLADNFWLATGLFLLMMGTTGVITPVQQSFIHQLIPSQQRATIVSFASMIGNGGGIILQASLGAVARQRSLSAGYVIGGAVTALALPVLFLLRRRQSPADPIHAGTRAADPTTPVACDVPEVAVVQPTASGAGESPAA